MVSTSICLSNSVETEGDQLALRAKVLALENPNSPLPPFQVAMDHYNAQHNNAVKTLLHHPKSIAVLVDVSSNSTIPVAFGKILGTVDPTRFSTSTVDGNNKLNNDNNL
jgi:hypothetical protein